MKRETFVAILSASLAEADTELLREAEGLVFWRRRKLRAEAVLYYKAGDEITYLARDGKTKKRGTIDHLNKYSVTLREPHPTEGYRSEVVAIERVIDLLTTRRDLL